MIPQKQVKDQELGKGYNKSLAYSKETGKPVRVVRGSKSESKYAPLLGFVISIFFLTTLIVIVNVARSLLCNIDIDMMDFTKSRKLRPSLGKMDTESVSPTSGYVNST